jgi:hypothetical protein
MASNNPWFREPPYDLQLPNVEAERLDRSKFKYLSTLVNNDYEALGIRGRTKNDRKANLQRLYYYMDINPRVIKGAKVGDVKLKALLTELDKLRAKLAAGPSVDAEFERLSRLEVRPTATKPRDQLTNKRLIEDAIKRFKKFEDRMITIDDTEEWESLCDTIRIFHERVIRAVGHKEMKYPTIIMKDLYGREREYTLYKGQRIDEILKYVGGFLLENSPFASDSRYEVTDVFLPVECKIVFKRAADIPDDKRRKQQEGDEADWSKFDADPEGEFWRWVNKTDIDLTRYQIFNTIDASNYVDNCFVYACIQSGVFSELEIDSLRRTIQTRKLPQRLIPKIAAKFECNFVVRK